MEKPQTHPAGTYYVALNVKDNNIVLGEDQSIESLIEKADKTGEDYIIAPVLKENTTYIF